MKQILVILSVLLVSTFALAAEPAEPAQTQAICAEEAFQVAQILFAMNNKTDQGIEIESGQIVDFSHVEDGGYEVFEFIFKLNGEAHTPYRVTTSIKDCKVISFETPFAN